MTTQLTLIDSAIRPVFHGSDYQERRDRPRLETQLGKIRELMSDHEWRTLYHIEEATGYGQASISAQLRNLRKLGVTVEKRHIAAGLFEYRVL